MKRILTHPFVNVLTVLRPMTRTTTTTSMNNFCTPMASLRINSGLSSSSPFIAPNPNPSQRQRQRLLSKASLSFKVKEGWRHSMFVNGTPVLKDGNLRINGKDALTGVPGNVVVTPFTNTSAFVGATATSADSRHVFKLGVIQDVRLLSLFRFTIWWMIPRMGNSASDIPIETQMLLLEASEKEKGPTSDDASTSYILFLPVLDGEFRSSLQGNSSNELEFCIESGNPDIVTSESLRAVFVNFGDNPFDLVKESMK